MISPRSTKTSSLYLPTPSLQNGGSCGISFFGPSALSKLRYRKPGISYGISPTPRLTIPLLRRRAPLLPMRIGSRVFRKSHMKPRFHPVQASQDHIDENNNTAPPAQATEKEAILVESPGGSYFAVCFLSQHKMDVTAQVTGNCSLI
jgi:hypothetical protein